MNMNLARLRKAAAEGGDTGSPEARDTLIGTFLQELTAVICEDAVDRLTDSRLRYCYYQWSSAVISGTDEAERIRWLATGVDFFPEVYAPEKQATFPENLVQLVRR